MYECPLIAVFLPSFFPAAPDSPPLNITFNVLDPNSVEFSWAPPPEELSNGIIAGYRISCVVVGNQMGEPITDTLGDVFTMTTLQEFMPATRYNCSLAARTSAGIGLNGTLIVLTSKDKHNPHNYMHILLLFFFVFFAISPPHDVRGRQRPSQTCPKKLI